MFRTGEQIVIDKNHPGGLGPVLRSKNLKYEYYAFLRLSPHNLSKVKKLLNDEYSLDVSSDGFYGLHICDLYFSKSDYLMLKMKFSEIVLEGTDSSKTSL